MTQATDLIGNPLILGKNVEIVADPEVVRHAYQDLFLQGLSHPTQRFIEAEVDLVAIVKKEAWELGGRCSPGNGSLCLLGRWVQVQDERSFFRLRYENTVFTLSKKLQHSPLAGWMYKISYTASHPGGVYVSRGQFESIAEFDWAGMNLRELKEAADLCTKFTEAAQKYAS